MLGLLKLIVVLPQKGFSGDSAVKKKKKSTFNAGNTGSVLDSGRSPGGGNGNLLQYSSLRNATERRPWWATVHGVPESDITCPLNNNKISLKKYNS